MGRGRERMTSQSRLDFDGGGETMLADLRMEGWMDGLLVIRDAGEGREPADGSASPVQESDKSEHSLLLRPHTELELSRQDQAGEPPDVL